MSLIADLEGLKFPDEMIIRFFFKNGLHRRTGRVFELGCGNANNLGLFAAYGWYCMGLDIAPELIAQGQRNFSRQGYLVPSLETLDMNDPLPDFGKIDVLLLSSSLYYVHALRARNIVKELAPALTSGAYVFCRLRTPADYRYGRGENIGNNSFRLTIHETSEQGCVNAFFDEKAMLALLEPFQIDPGTVRVMKLVFDNLGLDNHMIRNDELIFWGQTRVALDRE